MYQPTVSSDHSGGHFGGFPWHEKRSYKNFILHYFYVCLVLFPSCPSCLFSIIPPSVTEGVRSWGSLRKDGKLEMHLRKCLVCIQWFILPYTLKVGTWHYPCIWEGLPKRAWERNILYTTWILSKSLLCKLFLVQEACAEEAVTQQWIFLEPQQEHAGTVALTAREEKPCVCTGISAALSKGRGYLQTFCELSRLGSGLSLCLLNLRHMWASWTTDSVLGFYINSAKSAEWGYSLYSFQMLCSNSPAFLDIWQCI